MRTRTRGACVHVCVYTCVCGCVQLLYFRWDMSAEVHVCRTLEEIKECAQLSQSSRPAQRLGAINPPLFEIDLEHVVIDELHLLLRITDKLINNLVLRAAELDHRSKEHTSG